MLNRKISLNITFCFRVKNLFWESFKNEKRCKNSTTYAKSSSSLLRSLQGYYQPKYLLYFALMNSFTVKKTVLQYHRPCSSMPHSNKNLIIQTSLITKAQNQFCFNNILYLYRIYLFTLARHDHITTMQ